MSDSVLFYIDRSDKAHIVDSTSLPHTDDLSQIAKIAVAVLNAGYEGLILDEHLMANGRYFQAVNVNLATPEGRTLKNLEDVPPSMLPSPEEVLKIIRNEYHSKEGK
jgi:hypothetical protein